MAQPANDPWRVTQHADHEPERPKPRAKPEGQGALTINAVPPEVLSVLRDMAAANVELKAQLEASAAALAAHAEQTASAVKAIGAHAEHLKSFSDMMEAFRDEMKAALTAPRKVTLERDKDGKPTSATSVVE